MSEPRCPDGAELLPLAMDDDGSDEVQAHVQSCTACRRRLEVLGRVVRVLRGAGQELTGSWSGRPEASDSAAGLPVGSASDNHPPAAVSESGQGVAAVPEQIGDYRIIDRLGKPGGQADVYRALHPRLAKEVAIKWSRRPAPPLMDRDRLKAEARILTALDHPGLVRVHDLGVHDDRLFVVMEYVAGKDLAQRTEQVRYAPREAARLVAEIAGTVEFIHRRGVVHQDLKPHNVIIDPTGRPRLIDFGLAQLRDYWSGEPAAGGRISGTPAYMAPEQARGEPATERSDLFALGAVLYRLLTGKAPFAASSWLESLKRAAGCDWDRAALQGCGVPRRLAAICERAMAADPADRFGSAQELAVHLERFLHRPTRRAWAVATAAAALLLAATVWQLAREIVQPNPARPAGQGTDLALPEATADPVRIRVLRNDREHDLADVLPLRSGDYLHVQWPVPEGWHAALFWFDTEGEQHWFEMQPAPSSPARGGGGPVMVWPAPGQYQELIGPPGTELIVVCAGRDQAPQLTEVAGPVLSGQAWPELPGQSRLLIDPNDQPPVRVVGPRGPGNRRRGRPDKLLYQRAEQLRQHLSKRVERFAAVAFPHAP